MDQINDLIAWFKINPGKAAVVSLSLLVSGFSSGFWIGPWVANADDKIRQVPQIVEAVDGLTKLHEAAELEKRVKAQEEAKRKAELAALCRAGTLKDKAKCAEVGVTIE